MSKTSRFHRLGQAPAEDAMRTWLSRLQDELGQSVNSGPSFLITSAALNNLLQYNGTAWVNVAAIAYANLPTGAGSWNTGGGLITITNTLTVSGLLTASGGITVAGTAPQVIIYSAGLNGQMVVRGDAGTVRDVIWGTGSGNSPRWIARTEVTAESGANAGSNFQFIARDDSGVQIDIPWSITRAAGGTMTIARPATITGLLTASTGINVPSDNAVRVSFGALDSSHAGIRFGDSGVGLKIVKGDNSASADLTLAALAATTGNFSGLLTASAGISSTDLLLSKATPGSYHLRLQTTTGADVVQSWSYNSVEKWQQYVTSDFSMRWYNGSDRVKFLSTGEVDILTGPLVVGTDPGGSDAFRVGGAITINTASPMIRTKTTFTNGAGALTGTLTNAPATGNPTKWIPVDDNGTTRYIPAW